MQNNVELPQEVKVFSASAAIPSDGSDEDLDAEFEKEKHLRFKDIEWKLKSRKHYGFAIFFLLCAQNAVVFFFVGYAFFFSKENLKDTQLILTVLAPGTLLETAFMVKILVQWLFSDINYKI